MMYCVCVLVVCFYFFFSSRRRHTRCALVTGVQTCALPISPATPPEATAHPDIWPQAHWPYKADPALEKRIAGLLQRMTVEEKVGQVVQADIASVTPADVKQYHLGSVLNGGSSGQIGRAHV